jgi:cytochrome b561
MRRYSPTMIGLHWTMAGLILAAYLTSEGGPHVREDPPTLHFWLGLSILVLLVPRLVSRFAGGAPQVETLHRRWPDFVAKAGHLLLYALILLLPLTGWYAASRLGVTISLLGLQLPPITPAVAGPPGPIAELHQLSGNAILILAGLHALIAFWHQFVLEDGVLSRMLPWLSQSGVGPTEPGDAAGRPSGNPKLQSDHARQPEPSR